MLILKKVSKIFPGHFLPVLKEIDLALSPGEFCVIIGSNGSGKSTLMKCISGEYDIDKGEIIFPVNSVISSVIQDINQGTIPEMTLLENMVLSNLLGKKASFSFYQKKLEETIEAVKSLNLGLENYINKPLKHLSGGQRQMIATLMAINASPDILLFDEHTSALDPKTQVLLMEYTAKAIAQKKITSLMITHKLDDAIAYGNRLIMLHQGRIVLDKSNEEKQALDINKLLDLFHKYEDLTLRSQEL